MPDYAAALARYEGLVAPFEGIKVKGKANKFTSINGHMFSALQKDGQLTLRFSEADKKAYNAAHGTGDVISYNAVMRGYVYVTEEIMADEAALQEHFAKALDHAKSLPPK